MAFSAAHGLALLRAGLGLYLCVSALRKTMSGWFTNGEPLTQFIEKNLEGATPPYDTFLETVVLPNADLFAQLVALGEWVAGLSLLLGFLTRFGSILGIWLISNFMFAKGLPNFEGSSDRLYVLMCVVFAVTAAGLVWGLDGALRPWLATNAITRWLAGIPATVRPPVEVFPSRRDRRDERRAA